MAKTNKTRDLLISIAEPAVTAAGYELVDVHYVREPGGWVVRVFIDDALTEQQTTSTVNFSDCERVSRELSALFDVEDPLPHAYRLEVSSPGLARPLRTAAHFRRFAGEQAKITLGDGIATDTGPRRNFTGTLVSVDDGDETVHVIVDVDGTEFSLPLADITAAKLIPDWDALGTPKSSPQKSAERSADESSANPSAGGTRPPDVA